MADNFNSLIAHVTGGRRYCFVLMSYHEGFTFFEKLRKIVAEVTGFECIRADDLPGAGAVPLPPFTVMGPTKINPESQ